MEDCEDGVRRRLPSTGRLWQVVEEEEGQEAPYKQNGDEQVDDVSGVVGRSQQTLLIPYRNKVPERSSVTDFERKKRKNV